MRELLGVLSKLQSLKNSGYEIVISIDEILLDNRSSSNHSVTFIGNFKDSENGNVSFKVQSWGKEVTINATKEVFKQYYNGAT